MFFAVFSVDMQNRIGNTRGFIIDLAWFQYKILDKIVLVGRHTCDNLKKKQKNPRRYSTPIVVTRDKNLSVLILCNLSANFIRITRISFPIAKNIFL